MVTRESLINRLRAGNDPAAWDEFCRLYEPLVRTYVRRFRVQDHDADDLVQDVLAKLHGQMSRFELDHAKGKFRGWLRLLTDNTVRDWLKGGQRRGRGESPIDPKDLEAQFAESEIGDANRQLEWRRAVLALVLKQVREEFQDRGKTLACFELTALQNRPARNVAAELEIDNVGTVYVYAHRVLQRVRALCAEYDEELSEIGGMSGA